MSLFELWKSDKKQFTEKQIQQIIAFAGDGKLKDGNSTSQEFREYLDNISADSLARYASQCLDSSFTDSGLVLQDIINQVGIRLGFNVEYGRYRGTKGEIGNDGLWSLPSGHKIILEVKTTDAYRIDLNVIAEYRNNLIKGNKTTDSESSILIVVGRNDTGDLEAQIRGSRHAWDMRLISIDSLIKLMHLNQNVDDPQTIEKIHQILIPKEFTKLDEIINIVFSTAEEIKESETVENEEVDVEIVKDTNDKKFTPVSFHQSCIDEIENKLDLSLIKKTRSTYTNSSKSLNLICAISKEYTKGNKNFGYWFAFHPHQKEFVEKVPNGLVALGCGSKNQILLIQSSKFVPLLENMNTTERDGRYYWHVHISKEKNKFFLQFKKGNQAVDLTEYLLHSWDGPTKQ